MVDGRERVAQVAVRAKDVHHVKATVRREMATGHHVKVTVRRVKVTVHVVPQPKVIVPRATDGATVGIIWKKTSVDLTRTAMGLSARKKHPPA